MTDVCAKNVQVNILCVQFGPTTLPLLMLLGWMADSARNRLARGSSHKVASESDQVHSICFLCVWWSFSRLTQGLAQKT